jgi:hypothetical protein
VKSKPLEGTSKRWSVIEGVSANRALKRAYSLWLRDRFILEPSQSLFNPGVYRYIVGQDSDHPSLLVHYQEGGEHPGDTFEWELEDHFPVSIRFWSDQFPLSGFKMELKGWRILDTGIKVSLIRSIGPITLKIKAKSARSLFDLTRSKDPFEKIQSEDIFSSPQPTSQPNHLSDPKRAKKNIF